MRQIYQNQTKPTRQKIIHQRPCNITCKFCKASAKKHSTIPWQLKVKFGKLKPEMRIWDFQVRLTTNFKKIHTGLEILHPSTGFNFWSLYIAREMLRKAVPSLQMKPQGLFYLVVYHHSSKWDLSLRSLSEFLFRFLGFFGFFLPQLQ